ncbi:MAG TPA: arsenite methyltransferase [Bacteroidia bacterium]|jgi:ubiquinone/menaquinone biosynthesis C-methylase UbiE|nr:arsenite methyltransferase [Bacteroidia bacterium]
MKQEDEIKEMVRRKYSEIALQDKEINAASCCGATNCCESGEVYNIMADDYNELNGYKPEADLGLGCGLPTQFARIRPGDIVIDLGSGAGNDCFVARHECGPDGKVIGIDFTEAMIEKARTNADKLGFRNVEFRLGDIEHMPLADGMADVVVSNCVLNLVPEKKNVFAEILRVLKPGGHFSISDIVLVGQLPDKLRNAAEMYAGCVAGAIQKTEYLELIQKTGFSNIHIQKEKIIEIPDSILSQYMNESEILAFKESGVGIVSITVFAKKETCCKPGTGCC